MNLNPVKTKKYEKNQAFARMQNEPNLHPVCCGYTVMACSSATLLTYSGQTLRKKCCASSSLRPKQHTFYEPRIKICETNPIFKKTPKKPQKTGKALLFTPLFTKKVQLFTTFHLVNPLLNNSFFVSTFYNFSQLPYVDLCEGGTFRQKKYNFSQLFDQKKCETNPISYFSYRTFCFVLKILYD